VASVRRDGGAQEFVVRGEDALGILVARSL
jgi:hypothetical protein